MGKVQKMCSKCYTTVPEIEVITLIYRPTLQEAMPFVTYEAYFCKRCINAAGMDVWNQTPTWYNAKIG